MPPDAPSVSSSPAPLLLETARARVVIFDSASGTGIQGLDLSQDDFGGLDGCNEYLNVYRPDVVRRLHAANLDAGVDVVKTNSFGASAITLADYGIADQAYAINLAAARLARETSDAYEARDGRHRWVAGSMGPGTKLPSLGQIDFDTLNTAYREQARGLLDGGVDVILIETVYDLLQGEDGDHGRPGCVPGRRARSADRGFRDDRGHRSDAGGVGDRRRPDGAGAAGDRGLWDQLRDRPRADARAPALSLRPFAVADHLPAERGSAPCRERPCRVRPGPAGPARRARRLRGRVRRLADRRLLRHHPGAHGPGR